MEKQNYHIWFLKEITNFERAVVSEDNGKQNSEDSYMNKYQKHVACSYAYKLVRVDNKFSKPF